MPLRRVDINNRDILNQYLNDVLDYYKNDQDPSFGEWPTEKIGWADFGRSNRFYDKVETWFLERNIDVIRSDASRRFLSTFIIAAEFPPSIFRNLLQGLANRSGWLSLYRSPKDNLIDYIHSIDRNNYPIAQQQILEVNSEGFFAFLHLVQILSSIRYYLESPEHLDSTTVVVAEKSNWDVDSVLRISRAYRDIIIPPQGNQDLGPPPSFSYQLVERDGIWSLGVKHNLKSKVSIPLPPSLTLPRFSSGTLSVLSDTENISLEESARLVKIENLDGFLQIECSLPSNIIMVSRRNDALRKVQFIITVNDVNRASHQVVIGQISRNIDILIFAENGKELVSNTLLFRIGQTLRIVPLTDEIGENLLRPEDFSQEEFTSNLPIFRTRHTQTPIEIGPITLKFQAIPFSLRLRDQTIWEEKFSKRRKSISYFFSPSVEFELDGDIPEAISPTIEFCRRRRGADGIVFKEPIRTRYSQGKITPATLLPGPGNYILSVAFPDNPQVLFSFNYLPIKRMTLLNDRKIQIKMYSNVSDFRLLGEHGCTSSFQQDLVTINFEEYGTHEIEAQYHYKDRQNRTVTTRLRFTFDVIEEVLIQCNKIINVDNGLNDTYSLEKDFIANSYIKFQRTHLRDASKLYKIRAFMEYYQPDCNVFPETRVMGTDGLKPYSLISLWQLVQKNHYSKLLIIVSFEGHELFRVTFISDRKPILNLISDWRSGEYSSLRVLPYSTLQPQSLDSIERIPAKGLTYGVIERNVGNDVIATYPHYNNSQLATPTNQVEKFIDACIEGKDYNDPDSMELLKSILQSAEDSFALMKWLSNATEWAYPYDIGVFAKLLDSFPLLVAWAELARNPNNRDEHFALITLEAQKLDASGGYHLPCLKSVISHPRFSTELITIKDLEVLRELNLLPVEGSVNTLLLFYINPFVSDGKPIFSWLTLFWFRQHCINAGKLETFESCVARYIANDHPFAVTLAEEFSENLPKFCDDRAHAQNLEDIFRSEQQHFTASVFNQIPEVSHFLQVLDNGTFGTQLLAIICESGLRHAEPDLRGFGSSTKWKCIIFISLLAVCKQLGNYEVEEKLKEMCILQHETYVFFLKWLNSNRDTARIYNAYYEYWMKRFWENRNA